MIVDLKLDIGKSSKQSKKVKLLSREVASGKQPTLESLTKGRK